MFYRFSWCACSLFILAKKQRDCHGTAELGTRRQHKVGRPSLQIPGERDCSARVPCDQHFRPAALKLFFLPSIFVFLREETNALLVKESSIIYKISKLLIQVSLVFGLLCLICVFSAQPRLKAQSSKLEQKSSRSGTALELWGSASSRHHYTLFVQRNRREQFLDATLFLLVRDILEEQNNGSRHNQKCHIESVSFLPTFVTL